ncbi:PIN domain-containing protein [Spirosoma validum]|uniref:DNA-binding protein n=1 Tax=Spirosoma validum TaxID=2771355 RepID=A0A927B665_9BACT|nr:DNA-binding protein [Spirosoma validum]
MLFSFLISGRDTHLKFLADNRIFTTDFVFEELQLHQEVISQRTKLLPDKFQQFVLTVFERVTVVPNLLTSTQSYYQAFMLCRDIDPKDTDYVALSIQLDIPLLTRDKPLADGLRTKSFKNIITLEELFRQLDEPDSTNQPNEHYPSPRTSPSTD